MEAVLPLITRPDRSGFSFSGGGEMTAVRRLSPMREPELWRAVGNTPLIPLELPNGTRGRLWLKAEWLNPGGSVKDRAGRAILRDAVGAGGLPGERPLHAG